MPRFLVTWGLVLGLGVMVGERSPLAKPSADAPRPAPETQAARVVKEFPSYQLMGRRWRNVVVSPGPSLEALTALAKRLHAEDPTSAFAIFTDGNEEQFRRYMLWDLHFTKADSARYPKPKAWVDRHQIAIINLMGHGRRGGFRWQLTVFRGDAVRPPTEEGHAVDLE